MIAKVTRGDDMRGIVRYLFGPGDRRGKAPEVHIDQRAVAASEDIDVEFGVKLDAAAQRDLAWQLDAPRALHGTEVKDGHVWHLSLTNRAGDRVLTDAEWGQIATEAMDRLGFTEKGSGRPPCPWVAVRHGLSAAGNDHCHVAVSLVREDGTKVSIWQDRVKLSRACHDFEERYGLTVIDGRPGGGMPGLSRAELEIAEQRGSEPDRLVLARRVREASVASRDEAEFVGRLRASGVITSPRFAPGGASVVGYRVALRPAGRDEKPAWRSGGQLAKDLTLPKLRAHWSQTPEAQTAALAEWRRRDASRPLEVRSAENWRAAAERVGAAVEQLRAVPVHDSAAWRGAARETAGAFAAWSRQAEGDRPGPLAHAADTLARSAQVPRGGPPARRSGPVRDLRGVAAVVGYAMVQKDSGTGWVLLAMALTEMVKAIETAHVARGEALQAERLAAWSGEMADWQHRLRTVPFEQLVPATTLAKGRAVNVKGKATLDHPLPPPERHPGPERGFGR